MYLCNTKSSFMSRYAFSPRSVLTLAISGAVGHVSGFFTILQCRLVDSDKPHFVISVKCQVSIYRIIYICIYFFVAMLR